MIFDCKEIAHLGALNIARSCGGAIKKMPPQPQRIARFWCTQGCSGYPRCKRLLRPFPENFAFFEVPQISCCRSVTELQFLLWSQSQPYGGERLLAHLDTCPQIIHHFETWISFLGDVLWMYTPPSPPPRRNYCINNSLTTIWCNGRGLVAWICVRTPKRTTPEFSI